MAARPGISCPGHPDRSKAEPALPDGALQEAPKALLEFLQTPVASHYRTVVAAAWPSLAWQLTQEPSKRILWFI